MSDDARIFAFQFKAPRGTTEGPPYRFRIGRIQHDLLYTLAQEAPAGVYYVFPYYLTTAKLQDHVPALVQDTWLLPVADLDTTTVFGANQTRTCRCEGSEASINPTFPLKNLAHLAGPETATQRSLVEWGVPGQSFARWYKLFRGAGGNQSEGQRNPWLSRGLRVAIVEPKPPAVEREDAADEGAGT